MTLFRINTSYELWPITADLLQDLLNGHFEDMGFDGIKFHIEEVAEDHWFCPKCTSLYAGELPDKCKDCGTPRHKE